MQTKKEKEFLEAYEKYADDIYRHCYFRVYNKELAEDITQETFIKTWKYISQGKEIKSIRPFLYRVAVNLIIDNSRKKKELSLDERLISIGQEQQETIFTHFEAGEIIKLLEELSDNQKQVMVMRYVDELMPSEIADILEESSNAVSVRINQATNKLRQIIKEKHV
ncbi:MAG: RNA polymerase sigma factor [Candidatus Staskawiczbacteria bacterium]|nr:RNA polymerase sigma factor [Candidatus Staskawiczbacteria bacterium]